VGIAHIPRLAGVAEVVGDQWRTARPVVGQRGRRRREELLLAGKATVWGLWSSDSELGERDVERDRDGGDRLQPLSLGEVVGHQRVELGP
jgi:hypothetical protein